MKTSPWYSSKERTVHHNDTECTEGNNIERQYRVSGTGGLPLCARCRGL